MRRSLLFVTALTVALAGCGSSGEQTPTSAAPAASSSSSAPSTPAAPPTPAPEPTSAEPTEAATVASIDEAIERTGCKGYKLADQAAPFSTEYGTCSWKGDRLQLYSFASEENREKFLELSAGYGVTREQVVICGLVVAALDKQAGIKPLRELLGGEPI